jgi:hypothetical protein
MNRTQASKAGKQFGWMESAYPTEYKPAARRFSALSIACPACLASVRELCEGPRVCQQRMTLALELSRAGELEEVEPTQAVPPCDACMNGKRNRAGRPAACSPEHRCQRTYPTGHSCTSAVAKPGATYCEWHTPKSFNNTIPRLPRQRTVSTVQTTLV